MVCIAFHVLSASAQNGNKSVFIINGSFFNELPDEINKMNFADMKIFMLATPGGAKANGIRTKTPLSEKTIKSAIPANQIKEGEELLRRYNEAEKRSAEMKKMTKEETSIKVGDKLPEFSLTDLNGKTWTNADTKGKVTVFNLWFTGCGPCRKEMPELSTWKAEMPDVMFFSSTYETAEVARTVLKDDYFTWIPLVNDNVFHKFIGSNGYPLTIIVGKDGTIKNVEYGTSETKRAALKEAIKGLTR